MRDKKPFLRRRRRRAATLVAAASLMVTALVGNAAGAAEEDAATRAATATEAAAADAATTDDGDAAAANAAAAADLTGDIVFSEPSQTFEGEISVSLDTTVTGAEIRYSTDGELPTAESPAYDGTALTFTATTQLRAQAFVDGEPSGDPGTALYVARSVEASSNLPLLVMDAYGGGKPGRDDYEDVATLLMEPEGGSTSLSASPSVATRAGFHLRGQSSSFFEKAPYRLELWDNDDDDADYSMAGMPEDSDWVLRGPFSDKSLIHDAFAYSLGTDMGMAAPRFEFVEVYLNLDDGPIAADDYQGVYMLVETIKNSSNRLDLADLDEDDVSLPEISGGYIFAFEWMAAEEPTLPCTGSSATCWQYLEVKDPNSLNDAQAEWLTQYVQDFNDALHGDNPADPDTGYPAYIDAASFADLVIINELTREMDSYIRSTYFYKDRDEKIVAGPLWDYDLSFGTGGYFENQETAGWQYQQNRQPIANDWFQVLTAQPEFVELLNERWQELRQGVLSDAAIDARIAELTEPLTEAAERNFERWPNLEDRMVGAFITPTAPTWQGQVEYTADWLADRIAWLDGSGWAPDADTTPAS